MWTQRAGRAGRSQSIHAKAILLVEQSVFKLRKRSRRGEKDNPVVLKTKPNSDSSDDESDCEDMEEKEWVKKVEEAMREWIECESCRRDIADQYFDNPPCRKGKDAIKFTRS